MTDPMLSFYKAHKVSPVRQELGDLKKHFERRAGLYFTLGLLPPLITGRSVLEIGPGSGQNALYTASLKPRRYVLLEGNDTGVQQIAALREQYPYFNEAVHLKHQSLEQFLASNTEQFDVVLIEAVLGGFPDAASMLPKLLSLLQPGGILVLTTVDALSSFAENVRRLLAYRLIDRQAPLAEQLAILLPALTPHLQTLSAMSRRYDDWIVDNILLPHSAGHNFLSIPQAVDALPEFFDVFQTSPRIARDMRWYKSLVGEHRYLKTQVAAEYWRFSHNFLDYRAEFAARSEADNKTLYGAASSFADCLVAYEESGDVMQATAAARCLLDVCSLVAPFAPALAEAFKEAHDLLVKEGLSAEDVATMSCFKGVFGRGLQYVSIYRGSDVEVPS